MSQTPPSEDAWISAGMRAAIDILTPLLSNGPLSHTQNRALSLVLGHCATFPSGAERAGAGEPDWSGVNDRIDADDEIVATGARFHMERMSDEAIWFSINAIPFMLSASKGKLAWIPQESEWENLSLRAKRAAPLRTTEATGEPSIVITDDEQYALDLCDQYLYSTTENSDQADEDTVITDALTNGHLRLIFSLAERFVELAPPSADGASQQ